MYSYWDDNTLKDVTVAAGTWGSHALSYTTDALGRTLTVKTGTTLLEQYFWDQVGEAGLLDYSESYYQGYAIRSSIYSYDARNRPLGHGFVIPSIPGWTDTNGLAGTYQLNTFTYDRADHLYLYTASALGALPADNVFETSTYFGQPSTMWDSGVQMVGATNYTNDGRVSSRVLSDPADPNRVTQTFGYDGATGDLVSINASQAGATLQQDSQFYFANGDLGAVMHDRAGVVADHGECYRYDGRSQLVLAWTNNATPAAPSCEYAGPGGPSPYNQTFAVDEIGNITSGPAGTYSYPASGQGRSNRMRPAQLVRGPSRTTPTAPAPRRPVEG